MTKHEIAREKIEKRLKSHQWSSFAALRKLFIEKWWSGEQSVSDSTIRRVLDELGSEGKIDSKWACNFPRFFLVYCWDEEEK